MAKRTPASKPGADDITDEWGIYDPGKAGMPALFKRLGRPVLQASPKATRNERRRAHRPERTAHGVGLALEEARRRAGLAPVDGFEPISQSPARAMRAALRHHVPTEPAHFVPDAAPAPRKAAPAVEALHDAGGPPPARRKRAARRPAVKQVAQPDAHHETQAHGGAHDEPHGRVHARRAAHAEPHADTHARRGAPPSHADTHTRRVTHAASHAEPHSPRHHGAHAVDEATAAHVAPERARVRKSGGRAHRSAVVATAADESTHAPVPPVPVPVVKSGPPAPSPRRPRGPVPLAAWAHAAEPAGAAPPRRLDPLGFWRGWFRMPAEVALVEYARGARIHRLLIESIEDQPADFF